MRISTYYGRLRTKDLTIHIWRRERIGYNDTYYNHVKFGIYTEKMFFPNFKNPKKFWKSGKTDILAFRIFSIDLIILPNRSNRSNRKKSLNRLDRFIGQRINTCQRCC